MTRKKILMACSNYWDSPFQVGSHQIARCFVAAGWDVGFLSTPISPLHVARGITDDLKKRFATYRYGGRTDLSGKLWAYVPGTLLAPQNKPLLRSRWVNRNWASYSVPNVASVIARNGFGEVDLLYLDSFVFRPILDQVAYRKSVLRIADDQSGFAHHTRALQLLGEEIASTVDVVVYSAAALEGYVSTLGARRAFHLPNGVNFEHFARGSRQKPPEYERLEAPIAVYVGAMEEWFDFELVNEAAAALPDVEFVLIGPDRLARTRLAPRTNVHILGRRAYGDLPAYLHNASVGLIPFDVAGHTRLVNSVNPLKLYEYMACGLPVVATEWQELKTMASPATLCRTTDEFIDGIRHAVSRTHDRAEYVRYAEGARWHTRVLRLTEQLDL